jgi:regulator of telomere elongation helicase 1
MVKIKIHGVPIEMPFEPYPSQIVTMTKLIACLTSSSSGLIESPTGTGKSLSILCSILGYSEHLRRTMGDPGAKRGTGKKGEAEENKGNKLKIIVCSRTHKQLDQLVEQLRKTRYRPRISILASRAQYCISPKLADVQDKNTACNELVKTNGCAYFTGRDRLAKRVGDRVFDIEELKGEGRRCTGCPYYAARILNDDADIIFAPYNYLVDPKIRESTNIMLEDCIVVIDEAHNIEDVCRSSGSIELSAKVVEIMQNEILGAMKKSSMLGETKLDFMNLMEFFRKLREHAERTEDFNKTSFTGRTRIVKGREIRTELEAIGLTRDFVLKFKNSIYAIQKSEEAKGLVNLSTLHILEGLDAVISAIHFSDCDAYAFVFQRFTDENYRNVPRARYSYNFWLLDAAYTFRTFVRKVRSLVLLSGTLTPFASFSSELGHTFEHSVVAPHAMRTDQVFVSCIKRGHLNKDLLGTYGTTETFPYLDQLARIILETSERVKEHGGTLVFVPSYSFLENLQKRLAALKPANLLLEPKSGLNNDFEKVVKKYKSRISIGQGAILMCVYRGKASEGIDFRDSYARAVIAIGIPYPNLHDPQVELKKEFNDKYKSFNGRLWYETQAFRAVNQAVGRAIRHRDDWGVILLLDSRYAERRTQNQMSRWVAENMKVYESYDKCVADFNKFMLMRREAGPPHRTDVQSGLE